MSQVHEKWRSKTQIMQITGWTARQVERATKRGGLIMRPSSQIGANRKPLPEYATSSPALARFTAQLIDSELKELGTGTALVPVSDGKLATSQTQRGLFTTPASLIPSNSPDLAALTDQQREDASRKLDAITPLLEWAEKPQPFFTQSGRQVRTADDLAEYLAAIYKVSARTLWKWKRRYETGGANPLAKFKALAERARADRGLSRALTQYPKAAEYALIKYLGLAPSEYLEAARALRLPEANELDYKMPRFKSEKLPMTAVYAGIEREWPNWYNHGSKPPSYTTIRTFLSNLPDPIKVMAREGARAYENKCERHLVRDYTSLAVNSWWVSDHRLFDIFCWNDYFPEFQCERGAWLRVWLTTMEDVRSRRIVGWAFSVNPSSRSVMAAMRVAAMRFGMPKMIYMDNGEDYKLYAKVLAENFGVDHTKAKPFRPRSKPVESWHSTLSKRFDQLWSAAYAGHDAKNRSEENTLALRMHRQWRNGDRATTPLPTVTNLMEMFGAWIEQEYNEWPHGGQGMQGLSPRALFDRELPEEQRQPLDVAQLEPLFWQRDTRTVRNSKVQIFGLDYEPADAESDVALRLYNAREVRIACNPDDMAYALVYDAQGPDYQFVARLQAPRLVPYGPVSRDSIAAIEKSNAQFKRGVKQFYNRMERVAASAGIRSELDSLAARAGIATPVPISPLQLNPAVNDQAVSPEVETLQSVAGDRKAGLALRAAVGGSAASGGAPSHQPRYTEDVAARLRAAMREQALKEEASCD